MNRKIDTVKDERYWFIVSGTRPLVHVSNWGERDQKEDQDQGCKKEKKTVPVAKRVIGRCFKICSKKDSNKWFVVWKEKYIKMNGNGKLRIVKKSFLKWKIEKQGRIHGYPSRVRMGRSTDEMDQPSSWVGLVTPKPPIHANKAKCDGRTDGPSCRGAGTRLKIKSGRIQGFSF